MAAVCNTDRSMLVHTELTRSSLCVVTPPPHPSPPQTSSPSSSSDLDLVELELEADEFSEHSAEGRQDDHLRHVVEERVGGEARDLERGLQLLRGRVQGQGHKVEVKFRQSRSMVQRHPQTCDQVPGETKVNVGGHTQSSRYVHK